jgi:hypothetical protein
MRISTKESCSSNYDKFVTENYSLFQPFIDQINAMRQLPLHFFVLSNLDKISDQSMVP